MGINELRVAVTLVSLAVFIGIVVWAWSARRRERFEAAAQLPFEGEDA
ncbi:MAG: CcoQ/FixQ family Cbb3-type cytochrome c oxidase assembly chaperone [Roseateles depolymerans]|uniref:CcoQ/FixQ family Cbb3-type cytochrome c oxidase assembly chaperone n=1 Tax=Roseateles depolymerans TaxID=76731 RepID=A0A2W5G3M2_9BURK|nr:MAG: CcoQ/FixQ family Cbb3-type cytochrome c oxidase assembly chaperone [Roseateles depolymerans]